MTRKTIPVFWFLSSMLLPMIALCQETNYFCTTAEGSIYTDKNIKSEVVGKYIAEEYFLFSFEHAGWVGLFKKDSKSGIQRIGYILEKNGMA